VRSGFQRHRGQRVAEIRFPERDRAKARGGRGAAEGGERGLVGCREHHESVGGTVPVADDVRMRDGEIKGRMSRLAGLVPGWEIGAGDQVQAGKTKLTVRHE
jgi:hypothetical protein